MIDAAKSALKRLLIRRLRAQEERRRASLPAEFGGLPPSLWGYEIDAQGRLAVEGHTIESLVRQFGSPLYVVSLPWLRKTHDEFIGAFRKHLPTALLATSYKTNPVPAVLQALHQYGTHAEVISEMELWLAGRLGLPGERIIVNGPGKTRSMIARAVDMNVQVINIDGPGEIGLIAAEAQRVGRPQPVGVRVITSVGWSSQFGLSIASGDAFAALEQITRNQWLVPRGLHLHIGTGLKSVASYLQAIREVLEFAQMARQRLGVELTLFDLGGGYGVPTVRTTDEWDDRMVAMGYPARDPFPGDCPSPGEYASKIAGLFAALAPANPPPTVVLEPGRAITSSAQTLVLSIIAIKETGGSRKLILDGGKNITLPLGWETHRIFPASHLHEPFNNRSDLYGPLCHPGDIIARHLDLPALSPGECLAIMDAGAYFVPNQMNFSNPRPPIVTVDAGGVRLVRRRESFEDVFRLDDLP